MDRGEAAAAIAALCADAALRRHWHELHRAGDALRSDEVAALDAVDFCSRVAACIAAEPTVLAPRAAQRASGDAPLLDARPGGGCFGGGGGICRRTVDASARYGFGSKELSLPSSVEVAAVRNRCPRLSTRVG